MSWGLMIDFLWKNFFRNERGSTLDFLKNQPLFSSLNTRELKMVERLVHHRSYFAGEVIFKPGLSIGMYMVFKGQVQIFYEEESGQTPHIITSLKEGDFFGELSLVQEKSYHKTTAKATEAAELIGFFKPEMMSLIEKSPKLGVKILMQLLEIVGLRLKKAGEKFSKLSTKAES